MAGEAESYVSRPVREFLSYLFPPGPPLRSLSSEPRLFPRLIVFAVLVASSTLDDGSRHAHSHWLLIVGYAVGTALAAFRRTDLGEWLVTLLDAALVGYVLGEHLLIAGPDATATDAVTQMPALLLLLANALTLSVERTATFAFLVVASWTGAIAIGHLTGQVATSIVGHQVLGLAAFLAASAFVLNGVVRLRRAVAAAIESERKRSFLSRFVPPGASDAEGWSGLRARHACLLAVDIRGFSELTRTHPSPDVLDWLLEVRATVNACVSDEGGVVDKYVGDGVLAQFFEGDPRQQARAALASVRRIRSLLSDLNRSRIADHLPPIRLVVALHAGTVLAGVLDDGLRAELTVLGPAMNALSRIERRAKDDHIDVLASKRFARLLGPDLLSNLELRRLPRRETDRDAPDVVALIDVLTDHTSGPVVEAQI